MQPHGAELLALSESAGRTDESLPDAVHTHPLDEQHLDGAAGRPAQAKPRGNDPRVVDHRQLACKHVRQVAKRPMLDRTALRGGTRGAGTRRAARADAARRALAEGRSRGAQCPSDAESSLAADGRRRPESRAAAPAEDCAGRPHADLDAALERSREQIEGLAASTAELEAALPRRVGEAVRDGLRTEVLPVARHIAELRGLFNQANRRLERIEAELLAERKARIDDLALLVELVSSGWRGIDARLARLEAATPQEADANGHVEKLPTEKPAPAARAEQDEPVERAAAA